MTLPLLAIAALAVLALPGSAMAAGTSTLSGAVSGPSGGVGGVDVTVYDATTGVVAGSSTTSNTAGTVGQYTVSALNDGTYFVDFTTGGASSNVAGQWYGAPAGTAGLDESNASEVVVKGTGTASQTLAAGATISGTVLNGSTAESGTVYVDGASASGDDPEDDAIASQDFSGTPGKYSITGLPAGTYYLYFVPDDTTWASGYYSSAGPLQNEPNEATSITIAAGGSATANVSAQAPGTISGKVTYGGNPIGHVTVEAYDSTGQIVGDATSLSDGTYALTGLLPGAYKLEFTANNTNLAFQFSGGATTLSGATTYTVAAGQTISSGADAAMVVGGQIVGKVVNQSQAPLQGVQVSLEDGSGYALESAYTASDGTYTLFNVPAGTYYIEFDPSQVAGSTAYQTQYFGGKQVLSGSSPVSVTSGAATTGVSAVLLSATTAGQVSQTVTTTVPVVVPTPIPTDTGTSTVSGDVKVGHKLSAKVGGWQSGSTYSYQWYANGKAIRGATSSTYTVTGGYYKRTIQVAVTGKKSGYNWTTVLSKATAKVAEGSLTTHTPTVSGKARVGTTLKASATKWTKGTRFSYQWYAGGKAVRGARKSSFKVPSADKGKTLTVKVTGKLTGYRSVAKTSKATSKVS